MKKLLLLSLLFYQTPTQALPPHFVHLKNISPTIEQDIRYYTSNNFVGRPIKGYEKPTCILTDAASEALSKVQHHLNKIGYGLKVYDCYRPQSAVDDFIRWAHDLNDQSTKENYYPNIDKASLFQLSYISNVSGHSRGSTVDLTIIKQLTNQELDMGTPFDFFDPKSHPSNRKVTLLQFRNRLLLRSVMQKFGFIPLKKEWWHFSLKDEPYKNIAFNFPVK